MEPRIDLKNLNLSYEFTMASGDIDWSEGVISAEIAGKRESVAFMGTERRGMEYEHLELFCKLFCAAPEMRQLLTKLVDHCPPADLTKREWLRGKELLRMLDGAEKECNQH